MTTCGRTKDGELDRLPRVAPVPAPLVCSRCHERKPATRQRGSAQCIECFTASFRLRLKHAVRRCGVVPTSRVLVALSGGLNSSVLDRGIQAVEAGELPGRLNIRTHRVHVDCSAVNNQRTVVTDAGVEVIPLSAVFDIADERAIDPAFPATIDTRHREQRDQLLASLLALTAPANRYALYLRLLMRLLAYIARARRCSYVALGGSATRAASCALQSIAHGEGKLCTRHTSDKVTRFYATFIQPMHETPVKSIAYYSHFMDIQPSTAAFIPLIDTRTAVRSIDTLIDAFVHRMDGLFEQTVSNITKTIVKVRTFEGAELQQCSACALCGLPCSHARQFEHSSMIPAAAESSNDGSLASLLCCHSCRSSFGALPIDALPAAVRSFDSGDSSSIVAAHDDSLTTNTAQLTSEATPAHSRSSHPRRPLVAQSRSSMRAAIAEFILDADDTNTKREERRKGREQEENTVEDDGDIGLGVLV